MEHGEHSVGSGAHRCLLCRRPVRFWRIGDARFCDECAERVGKYMKAHSLTDAYASLAIKHLWEIGGANGWYGAPEPHYVPEFLLRVPTFYGNVNGENPERAIHDDFDQPFIPVLVREADGVRVVLGSHCSDDLDVPDILIERRPRGWTIFLHPVGSSDPSGYVFFNDDGSSFALPEGEWSPTPPIRMLPRHTPIAAIDHLKRDDDDDDDDESDVPKTSEAFQAAASADAPAVDHGASELNRCELCESELTEGGDNWDGLCPDCADVVSDLLDKSGRDSDDRHELVSRLQRVVRRSRNA